MELGISRYDQQSKVVVKEYWSSASSPTGKSWAWSTIGGSKGLKEFKNGEGAASLLDTTTRIFLTNLSSLTVEHFTNVPWVVAERLWKQILQHDMLSVGIWGVLVQAYSHELEQHPNPQQLNRLLNYRNTLKLPSNRNQQNSQSRDLLCNLQYMTAPKLEWMTVLSLFDISMTRHEWHRLSSLKSLGCLYVHNSGPSIGSMDEIVVKHWAIAARDEGAFPKLELALFVNQAQLSLGILENLAEFPSMRVMHLTGPHLNDEFTKEVLVGTRWKFYNESILCLKLFRTWATTDRETAFGRRALDLWKAFHEEECKTLGVENRLSPRLNVISGYDPDMQRTHRQTPLWFELSPRRSSSVLSSDSSTKRNAMETTDSQSKKPRIREKNRSSVTVLMQGFGTGLRTMQSGLQGG